MIDFENECIMLDGVVCTGDYMQFCPRRIDEIIGARSGSNASDARRSSRHSFALCAGGVLGASTGRRAVPQRSLASFPRPGLLLTATIRANLSQLRQPR